MIQRFPTLIVRTPHAPGGRRLARILIFIASIVAAAPSSLCGQDSPAADRTATKTGASVSGPEEARSTDRHDLSAQEERNRAYQVGVLMIGGILIAGVGLLALVIIWGHRARRIARQPLPPIAPRDELWFLKNKKRESASPAGEPPATDEAAG